MAKLRLRRLRDLLLADGKAQQKAKQSDPRPVGFDLFTSTAVLERAFILSLKGKKTNQDCILSLWHFTLCNWKKISHAIGDGCSSSFPFDFVLQSSLARWWNKPEPCSISDALLPLGQIRAHVWAVHCATSEGAIHRRLIYMRTHRWHRDSEPPRQGLVHPGSAHTCTRRGACVCTCSLKHTPSGLLHPYCIKSPLPRLTGT